MSAPPPAYDTAVQPGYPPNQGYPPPQPGYPPAQPGYPPAQPAYPPTQPGYPPAQPSYPPAQPGYGGEGYATGYGQPYPPAGQQYPPPTAAYGTIQPSAPVDTDMATEPTGSTQVPESDVFFGGYVQPDDTEMLDAGAPKDTADAFGGSFSEKAIRHAFIRKVYLLLTAQLMVTVAFIAFFLFHSPTQKWVKNNSWFYYVSYAVFLVTYITLVCCPSVRRKSPGNYICLTVFTLAFSYMTATITSYYNTDIVLIAAGITALVTLSITIFAIQTKIDFTMCTGLLLALSLVVFFFGIACMIVYLVSGPNYILHCVYGALAALLFSLFLAYDTQMLMGGRKHQLSPEEYIYGALQLYLDIVYIFLIILSFFGGKSN